MQQLAEEELKAEMEAQQRLELERRFRMHIEARQAYHDQMAARMKKLQLEAEEEAAYRQQVNLYGDSRSIFPVPFVTVNQFQSSEVL
jgi:hypothetical protein